MQPFADATAGIEIGSLAIANRSAPSISLTDKHG